MVTAEYFHLSTLADSYGAPLAEYFYWPEKHLLLVRWHGQLTSSEVIRGAMFGMQFLTEHPFERVLNDKRDTGGDWSEALPWLQYEWAPRAAAAGLHAIAYLLSPDLPAQIVSHEFVEAMRDQIRVSLFTNEKDAQRQLGAHWLQTQ